MSDEKPEKPERSNEERAFEYRPQGTNYNPMRIKSSLDHVGLEVMVLSSEIARLLARIEQLEEDLKELQNPKPQRKTSTKKKPEGGDV